MIRNAGGRAMDAVRTISALQTIGAAKTVLVVHHTDCGMSHFSDADIRQAMLKIAPEEERVINNSRYGEIDEGSIQNSLQHDVLFLQACPFVVPGTQIVGLAYDIKSGILTRVIEATR
ncbi:carbonic anhydrase [Fusarium austroafricanum]|uniref:Carbonic anhydrase n=1 Tax=Fusarium austroafricanum TaxID=2364996 RepID=A0A8H4KLT7_9HYPO|nr:carbonic anhydrase [Fusarium austroafricanum]